MTTLLMQLRSGITVGSVDIGETTVEGDGGYRAPILVVPVILKPVTQGLGRRAVQFVSLGARLRISNTVISDARPTMVDVRLTHGLEAHPDRYLRLEFPLDARKIEWLEEVRAGNALVLQFELEFVVELFEAANVNEREISPRWLFVDRQSLFPVQPIRLTIPQSHWAEHVLQKLGHDVVHIVEIPIVPLLGFQELKTAFSKLKEAQHVHSLGQYDQAAGLCRQAIDQFISQNGKGDRKWVFQDWLQGVSEATRTWLDDCFGAIKPDAGGTYHPSSNRHFDRLESQLLISITVSLMAYAARAKRTAGCPAMP